MPAGIKNNEWIINNWIEVWKAIHGGCWPGPPPDRLINRYVSEVIAGLALYNISRSFSDAKMSKQVRGIAVQGLKSALPGLQRALKA